MKTNPTRSTWIKLAVLSLLIWLYTCGGAFVTLISMVVFSDHNMGYMTVFLVVLMFLILLVASALLIDSVKTWAMTALPIQVFLCLFPVVVTGIEGAGLTWLGLMLFIEFGLPLWTGYLFTVLEIAVIQLLGIGLRAFGRKMKEKYGSIPF